MGIIATQIVTQGMFQSGAAGAVLLPLLLVGGGAALLALALRCMDDEWAHERRRHRGRR